jgi:choline-glycine betaine transporter
MINFMLSPTLATLMSVLIVILLMTYLVTSADSAVLIINTIAAAGDESPKGRIHIITWGIILTPVIAGLLLTKGDGLAAINTAMIIGALPFSVVMALMGSFDQSLGTGRHAQRGQDFPNSRTCRVELQKLVAFVATSTHTDLVVIIRLSGEQHDRT